MIATDRPRAHPLRGFVQTWNSAGAAGLRLFTLALAALALTYAGALALAPVGPGTSLAPWCAVALPAGLAVVARWRWGSASLAGCLVGMLLALLSLAVPVPQALVGTLATGGGAWISQVSLRQLRFDARLERSADTIALALAVLLATALPMALALAVWDVGAGASSVADVLFGDWAVLGLGMLATSVAALAFDRSLLRAQQQSAPWRKSLVGGGAVALMLCVVWLGQAARSPLAAAALFVPHLVLALLAVRGQLALAASSLLAVGLLVASGARAGRWPWDAAGSVHPLLFACLGSALAVMLIAHAAMAEWRARAKRWEWALDGSRLGVADWHLQREESFASAAWRKLSELSGTGLTQGTPQFTPQTWQAQVHPDDREPLGQALEALTSGEDGRRQLELRLPRAGGWRWAEATLLVIERDGAGRPLRLLATLTDVQERHEALERQLMSASLFQHLHEGLLITDADLRVLDLNPAYSQILGVPREKLLGSVPSLLQPAPADPVARQQRAAMWASLRDQGSWRGDLVERHRDGQMRTLATTISTVCGPAQDLRYHVLVISDVTEQQAQRELLERQARFDELTRLPNRAFLSELLDDAIVAADRDGYLLVVCYLDLDKFKPINDRWGHVAGDRLLAELAGRLRSALRSREHWVDSAARLGGDEFVLLLRAGTLEEARLAVERVLRVVSQPYVIDPQQDPVQITASMGATVYPVDRSDADALLRHADHAMYGAKQAGRNGYLFFDPEHRRRTEQRVMAIGRIQEALDQQEFVLFYQPKVDMRSNRVLGFEALLRWEHPQQGLVAPLQFLPLIEETGLSSRIGDWVLSQALDHLLQWRRAGLDFKVSVNISARHLQEPDFTQRLSELLARHGEPLAGYLELEMLETAAQADIEATSALVSRCKEIGVSFALDDFGTRFSTLDHLRRLPVDVLKIDRSFVHHMLDDPQDRAIVEGVIGLARIFGRTVVAEGVESPAQARTLLELGCDIGQGTGIAAPMPSNLVAGWVRDYRGMFALTPADAAHSPARAG